MTGSPPRPIFFEIREEEIYQYQEQYYSCESLCNTNNCNDNNVLDLMEDQCLYVYIYIHIHTHIIYIYNSDDVANNWVEKQSLSSSINVYYSRMENNDTNIYVKK